MRQPENDFDMVLLDTTLPDMDATEVLACMKDDPKLCEIAVIALTYEMFPD